MGHKKTSRRCCECRAWYSPNTAASLTQKTCSKKCRLSRRGARAKERRAADLPTLATLFAACGAGAPVPLEAVHLGETVSSKQRADWSRATFLSGVKTLNLGSLDGADYAGLLSCPHLDALEVLVLGKDYDNRQLGFDALVRATPPPRLRYLEQRSELTQSEALTLARSPLGRQLWALQTEDASPEVWRAFLEGGLPVLNEGSFNCPMFDKDPTSENTHLTTFREEY